MVMQGIHMVSLYEGHPHHSLYTWHPLGVLIYKASTGSPYMQGILRESLYTGHPLGEYYQYYHVILVYTVIDDLPDAHICYDRSIFVFYYYVMSIIIITMVEFRLFFLLFFLKVIFWVQYQIMTTDSKHSDSAYFELPSKSHRLGVLDLVRKCALCIVLLWCRLHTFTLNLLHPSGWFCLVAPHMSMYF